MPSIRYSSSPKKTRLPFFSAGTYRVIVSPGLSGADSQFDSRKSRLSDRAVQIRADCGAGSVRMVNVDSPPAPRARSQVILGMGRSVTTWLKERSQASQSPVAIGFQSMSGVGKLDQVLWSLELVPVEVKGVVRPVAVVGAVDEQLGLRQPSRDM